MSRGVQGLTPIRWEPPRLREGKVKTMAGETGPHPVRWDTDIEGWWHATCNRCPKVTDPCSHIKLFFQQRFELMHDPLPEESIIVVPIFFSHIAEKPSSNVLTEGRNVAVNMGEADDYGNIPFTLRDVQGDWTGEVIDVISSSSGVWAIRNSVLQYLYAAYRTVEPCTDSRHPVSQMFSKDDPRVRDAKSPKVLNNIIDLILTGKCSYCLSLDDQSQFIPDI